MLLPSIRNQQGQDLPEAKFDSIFIERQANTGNVAHVPKYICFYVKLNAFVVTESDSFTIENLTMYFLLKLIGVDLLAF